VAILAGNLGTGAVLDVARSAGADRLVWVGLTLIGVLTALAVHRAIRPVPGRHRQPDALPAYTAAPGRWPVRSTGASSAELTRTP
jgi:hypothetical protein